MIDAIAYLILSVAAGIIIGAVLINLFYDPDNSLGWLRMLLGWGIVISLIIWAIWHVFKLPIPHFS